MAVALPLVPSDPSYEFVTSLGVATYTVGVRWNGRDGAWYLDLADADGDPIRSGLKIALGVLIGDRSTDPRWPAGVFLVTESSGTGLDAGIDDLGARVRVLFLSYADDLATLQGVA